MAQDSLARKDKNEFEAANNAYYGNSPLAEEALKERQATKTVQGDFESKGIAARAYKKRTKEDETATNEALEATLAVERNAMFQRMAVATMQNQLRRVAAQQAVSAVAARAAFAGASRSAVWWLLGVMFTVYIWQFTFAVLAIVGFGGQAIVTSFLEDNWIGKAINFVVGFFVDLKSLIPFEYIAFAFWGIGCLLSLATIIALLIWFTLRGKSILHGTVTTLISFTCIALSILPVTNLFPWLILWALYVEIFVPAKGSLFSTT